MANSMKGRDGKQGFAWLLDVDGAEETTNALVAGDIGFIKAKAATLSEFGNLSIGSPFFANSAVTLASGDKFVKATPYFMGFATSKSVSYSKETQDITCDYDVALGKTAVETDGTVTTSGSISCQSMLASGANTAINKLKSRFYGITEIAANGDVTTIDADTTNKDIILIIWNFPSVKASGDVYDMEILPVLFTSLSKGASYGSPQNFDLDFTSNATDENNFIGGALQVARGADNPFAGSAWSMAR